MFKALLIALVLVLLSGSGAHAAPVGLLITAIGTALKAGGLVALLIKGAFSLALSVGMSLIQQARARRQARKENNTRSGVTLQVQMGDALPRSYLLGTRATAGQRFYIGYWGEADKTPNAYITDCVVVSCLPSRNGSQGLEWVSVGKRICTVLWDQPHPDGRGYPLKELRDGNTDYGWVKYLDGTQTAADPFLISKFGNHSEHPYLPSMIGRGCQIVILTTRHNYDFFNNQLQQGVYQPKPMRIYSLRKDSTAGGNGACRWDDPTTWESSDNLADLAYTVARGLYYRGRWVHGGRNFSTYRLPPSAWMAAANVCDMDIAGRRQYRGGLEVFVDSQPIDVIEDLRVGCSGRFAEVGGQLKLLCGAPGAPVYSFTDESIVVTQDQGFEPFASVASTHNTITGVYPEPAQLWTTKDAPEYSVSALLIRDDGQKLPIGMEYDSVPFSAQVQALMKTDLEESQRWRIHEAFFGPEARALEPNDPIAYTSERNSYSNKLFIVVRATPSDGLKTRVIFKEWEPSDYQPPSIVVPPVIGPVGSTPLPPQIMSGWTVAPAIISNASSTSQRPSIKVGCAADLDGIERVWVKVRRTSDHVIVFDSDSTRYAAPFEWILNGTFTPNTDYEVAGEYVSNINRNQEQSSWLPVRTPNVLFDSADILAGAITAEKIADAAVSADKLMNEAVTSLKLADQAVSTAKLQVGAVTAAIIANQAVDITKFASGLEPVSIVAAGALPTVKTTTNITWQGELYTWNGTAYAKPQTGVADGSITAAKLANAAVTADKLANSAVTHDKIVAGAIYGDLIAAQSITARELILTDFSNIVDLGFASGDKSAWGSDSLIAYYLETTDNPLKGTYLLQANGKDCLSFARNMKVSPGESYNISVWVYNTDPNAGNDFYFGFLEYDQNQTFVSYRSVGGSAVKNSWINPSANYTVPASGVYYVKPVFSINKSGPNGYSAFFGKPNVRRAANAQLIVDGSIIATKIAVGAITADAISANAITTAKIMAGAVQAAQISAGAITTEKLAVGLGQNWLSNSDFAAGLQGWGAEYVNYPASSTITMRQDQYGVRPYGSIQLRYLGTQADAVIGVWPKLPDGNPKTFSCVPGQYLELSGRYFGHRTSTFQVWVQFLNAAGDLVSYANPFQGPAAQNTDPNYTLGNYVPFFAKLVVPAGAVQCRPFWRLSGIVSGSGDSYVWVKNLFFGLATANQTEATQWSDGGLTLIGPGNLTTGSVLADSIGALAVTAAKIAAGAITAEKISAGAVTADKIAANTITGDKIVAGSVTAKSLLLSDFSNIVDMGFSLGNLDGWNCNDGLQAYYKGAAQYNDPGWIVQSNGRDQAISKVVIPVKGGDVFTADVLVYNTNAANATALLVCTDTSGAVTGYPSVFTTAKNTWTRLTGKLVIPAGSSSAYFVLIADKPGGSGGASTYWSQPSLRRAYNASLIVDGSITAAQIAANSITADKMNVTSLAAISANLGNVNIENAIIGNLQVDTSNIKPGAISAVQQGTASNSGQVNITIDHGDGSPNIVVFFTATGSGNNAQTGLAIFSAISVTDNSAVLGTVSLSNNAQAPMGQMTTASFAFFTPPAGRTQTAFRFYTSLNNAISTSSISLKMMIMTQKR